MNIKIAAREFWKKSGQIALYVVCLSLSLGVFMALDSVQESVVTYVQQEKKNLVGGDLILESNRDFSADLKVRIEAKRAKYEMADVYEFSSMAQSETETQLSQIQVVSSNYPLYGRINLRSGKLLSAQLVSGQVVVEPSVLDALSIQVGDRIQLGDVWLTVADVVEGDDTASLSLFQFGGGRIFVAKTDLSRLNLIGDKSRVKYKKLVKTNSLDETKALFEAWEPFVEKPAKINTLDQAETMLSRFSDRFLLFLKLIVFSLLLLTAIGMVTLLQAFLQSQRNIIAIRKSMGETSLQILFSYLWVFLFWTLVAIGFSLLVSLVILGLSQTILQPVLPNNITISLSWVSVGKTVLIGILSSLVFALIPLFRTLSVRAAALFRFDTTRRGLGLKSLLTFVFGLIFYISFIWLELQNIWLTGWFVLGVFVLFFVFWLISVLVLWVLQKRAHTMSYFWKLSVRSLNRAGANTALFVSIFTLSLTVLFSLLLTENVIQQQFVESYPKDTPNIFVLDLRRDQIEPLRSKLDESALEFFPVVRSQIVSVNTVPVETLAKTINTNRNIKRSFNMTYYDTVRSDEKITLSKEPNKIFAGRNNESFASVSVMDEIANVLNLQLGDTIVVNVQGIEIESEVTSIRTRTSRGPAPFFYFVFEPEVLSDAPQTLFATLNIPATEKKRFKKELVQEFPQISLIDTESVGGQVSEVLSKLSAVTSFFGIFNLFVGFVVFLSSLMATSENRKQETAYYRLQGMSVAQVWKTVWLELFFVATFSVIFSVLSAFLVAYFLLSTLFEISLLVLPIQLYVFASVMYGVVFLMGYGVLKKPLSIKPIECIRNI